MRYKFNFQHAGPWVIETARRLIENKHIIIKKEDIRMARWQHGSILLANQWAFAKGLANSENNDNYKATIAYANLGFKSKQALYYGIKTLENILKHKARKKTPSVKKSASNDNLPQQSTPSTGSDTLEKRPAILGERWALGVHQCMEKKRPL